MSRRPAGPFVVAFAALLLAPAAWGAPDKPELVPNVPLWTTATSVTFTFSGNGAGFLCRFDAPPAAYAPCSSPATYTGLDEGEHAFHVRAVDGSGASPPSNFEWTVDRTAPGLPANVAAEAVSPAGAIVTFSAPDNLDPDPALQCAPASGSTFALGETTVPCTVTDAAGNESSGAFSVTVRDTTPPTLVPRADVVTDKQSPQGAVVDYALPAAVDAADPTPAVACEPPPGTLFPVGTTPVTCRATDVAGLTSDPVGFDVVVQEGPVPARPTITAGVPRLTRSRSAEFHFTVAAGVEVRCRLDGPSGPGSFVPCATRSRQAYSGLPDGAYLFTVQARNAIGNVSQASRAWTVDRTSPAAVVGFAARGLDGRVALRWRRPIDVDYRRVRILRSRVGATRWRLVAERRTARTFTDRRVRNGVRYRYRIRSYDRAGNGSALVAAGARPSAVFSPQFGAVLGSPPLVDWRSVRRATYYNMQLWRNGRKVLSAWPKDSRYRLRSSWRFAGKRQPLVRGRYTVYVWPGFGPKAAVRYGPLLGTTSFRMR